MRICFVTYPSVMLLKGGPRTQIFQTKIALEKLGAQVVLFDAWEDAPLKSFDFVHLFGANIGSYHLAREIHKLGIPMVVSPIFFSRHAALFIRSVLGAERIFRTIARGTWMDFGLLRDICNWSKAVLPNTTRERNLLAQGIGIPSEKLFVIPNGVEERFYAATPDLFNNTYKSKDFILNVGHIGPERKNVYRLIHALQKINAPAFIIGRIEDTAEGRRCLEEAKKSKNITILDSLPHDSELLASAYAACDVFALPSQFETPGIAALEAGLAGAKIVITKNGGTQEYFGENADYVEPTSWELIHHGITTALNKKKNPALRDHIKKFFLWSGVGEITMEVYKSVIK
ncbi:MAG: glycosyltransferase family 4 protein [Bacteroidota bacterium]